MALRLNFVRETDQVLFAGNSTVKEVILNRPYKLNSLDFEMVSQMTQNLTLYENEPSVKLVILKANGKAFCTGGDLVSIIATSITGHWSLSINYYEKLLTLIYLIATYKQPVVSLFNGVVMGAGAGLSMNTTFRVVTEKAAFAMPEASVGLFPDVGSSYFLSRLPGFFGEYLGLTGRRLNGAEMIECGLATHFVPSKKLNLLENSLQCLTTSDKSTIAAVIDNFTEVAFFNEESPLTRLDTINKCFSKATVEEIVLSLEKEIEIIGAQKWITDALSYMRTSCPASLKIWLRSVREGRVQNIEQCLSRDHIISTHCVRRTISSDFHEGTRAKLFDKDNKPKWDPPKLELVSEEIVNQYFREIENDENWECLRLPHRSNAPSKL